MTDSSQGFSDSMAVGQDGAPAMTGQPVRWLPVIDILCRVVDNYGDIGVVYRLARVLSEIDPELRLRLIVDDLAAFSLMAPGIDATQDLQRYRGWTVLRWEQPGRMLCDRVDALFREEPPRIVLECFACGRPGWFEAKLFDPSDNAVRLIVDVEYLSAEDWIEDVHRMPGLTRSPLVKKHLFMPGFTKRSGGLAMDTPFLRIIATRRALLRADACDSAGSDPGASGAGSDPGASGTHPDAHSAQNPRVPSASPGWDAGRPTETLPEVRRRIVSPLGFPETASLDLASRPCPERKAAGENHAPCDAFSGLWILIFCYAMDFSPMIADIEASRHSGAAARTATGDAGILALTAAGQSQAPFMEAWAASSAGFSTWALPFLPQERWDEVLGLCDVLVVRGEESLSRAALSGIPFLWQAYPQEGAHHLVKVKALLGRMRPHFEEAAFAVLEAAFLEFNGEWPAAPTSQQPVPTWSPGPLHRILQSLPDLVSGFDSFGTMLRDGPELGHSLLTFLREMQ